MSLANFSLIFAFSTNLRSQVPRYSTGSLGAARAVFRQPFARASPTVSRR